MKRNGYVYSSKRGFRTSKKWPVCKYCGVQTEEPTQEAINNPNKFTWQHIMPQYRGGRSIRENLKACCYRCNQYLCRVDDCPAVVACMEVLAEVTKEPLKKMLSMYYSEYVGPSRDKINSIPKLTTFLGAK